MPSEVERCASTLLPCPSKLARPPHVRISLDWSSTARCTPPRLSPRLGRDGHGVFRHSGHARSIAISAPLCDGISTFRRSFRGARGQRYETNGHACPCIMAEPECPLFPSRGYSSLNPSTTGCRAAQRAGKKPATRAAVSASPTACRINPAGIVI